jgi:hypothetical protein
VTFTAVTSLLAINKSGAAQTLSLHEHTDTMIEQSRQIFHFMESRVPISSQALQSLKIVRYHIAVETGFPNLNTIEEPLMSSVEQGIDSGLGVLGDLDSFDWLANPSALLSRQTPGLDMSWLTGSDVWFS